MIGARLSFVILIALASTSSARHDLTGKVNSNEKPVAGATVYIYTAGVRTGTSSYCPSCYADCGKRATTDADGSFAIPSLDPALIFRVLVVADGYEPTFVTKVDPAKGAMSADLKPRRSTGGKHTIWGRVQDEEGNPVVGAEVSPDRIRFSDRRDFTTTAGQVDPLTITDGRGQFVLICKQADVEADLDVRARGLAPAKFRGISSGGISPHRLGMMRGATVRGRLMANGKPVAGAAVGLVQSDRRLEDWVGESVIGTDQDGRFELVNVKPDASYLVYGKMESLQGRGAALASPIDVGGNHSINDAGDLRVIGGHVISGKVKLSDGKPVPAGTRIGLSRKGPWDSLGVQIGEDGSFTLSDVPPEPVSLSLRVRGYHVSDKNRSLDPMNWKLVGVVAGDRRDLIVLLDPGDPDPGTYHRLSAAGQQEALSRWKQALMEPIRGAE